MATVTPATFFADLEYISILLITTVQLNIYICFKYIERSTMPDILFLYIDSFSLPEGTSRSGPLLMGIMPKVFKCG